jgi:hypothetical protein
MTQTSVDPLAEARKLADAFREGAAQRDADGRSPRPQRDLIRASGLLNSAFRLNSAGSVATGRRSCELRARLPLPMARLPTCSAITTWT